MPCLAAHGHMNSIQLHASQNVLHGVVIIPECATKALRGCVRLPSNEAGRNLIMSCQSLALNSPALQACPAHALPVPGSLSNVAHVAEGTCLDALHPCSWRMLVPLLDLSCTELCVLVPTKVATATITSRPCAYHSAKHDDPVPGWPLPLLAAAKQLLWPAYPGSVPS